LGKYKYDTWRILPVKCYIDKSLGKRQQASQQIIARGRVHDLINSWKREIIFWTCLIETSVVNAHLKLLAILGVDNRVSQPPRVVGLPDEVGFEQLFDFFMDEVLSLNRLLPRLLLYQSSIGVDL
jgi:hypothetical protein